MAKIILMQLPESSPNKQQVNINVTQCRYKRDQDQLDHLKFDGSLVTH